MEQELLKVLLILCSLKLKKLFNKEWGVVVLQVEEVVEVKKDLQLDLVTKKMLLF